MSLKVIKESEVVYKYGNAFSGEPEAERNLALEAEQLLNTPQTRTKLAKVIDAIVPGIINLVDPEMVKARLTIMGYNSKYRRDPPHHEGHYSTASEDDTSSDVVYMGNMVGGTKYTPVVSGFDGSFGVGINAGGTIFPAPHDDNK